MFLSVPSALFCEKDEKFAFPPGKQGIGLQEGRRPAFRNAARLPAF
jgi:hypothetical protein